jgi:lincosamide and streptogramin A transport system ATP-binding/permease protein
MSNIEIKNLTFGYANQGTLLFDHANLNIDETWKLGLIGRNGRGKTTLLKLLQNQLNYHGEITHRLSFNYFPQHISDDQQLAIYALQEVADVEQWQIERELNFLGVDPDILWRSFASLSGGEQTKILLALLFVDDIHFPLIDEPTNHLDINGRQQVASYLQKKRQGFIVVSHDRHFIDQISDHVMSIEKQTILLYQGNFSTYENEKQLSDNFEREQNEKLKKDIHRLKQSASEKLKWSLSREGDKYGDPHKKGSGAIGDTGAIGARAARVMKRSKNLEHRMTNDIESKEQLLKNIEYIDPLSMNFQPTHHQTLLTVKDLQLSYDQRPLFNPVTFELKQKQRLALMGPNGAGKSSIIQFILAQFAGDMTGLIDHPQNLAISYVRQNYEDNRGTIDEFTAAHHLDREEFLNNLHKLGMERSVFNNKIETMSMGQRKKIELAKSLSQPAELYIWDEPLNYLDIFNQEQLEKLILSVTPTMLIVEHDQSFIEKVATQTVTLRKPVDETHIQV